MNYSGGDNKTHGQVERAYRIDSFEAGKVKDRGVVFATMSGWTRPFHCNRYSQGGREMMGLSSIRGQWRDLLDLTRVRSGFGGSRAFWLCPSCGRRARYLYIKEQGFVCRECASLNYLTQQRTQRSINHYRDGMKLAREKLSWWPPDWITPMDFPRLFPDRPRYMHKTTYQRRLARFRKYQAAFLRDSLREMLAIQRR